MATFELHAKSAPYFDVSYIMSCSNYQSYNLDPVTYSFMPYCSSEISSAPGAAYLANFEGPADEGWYLDSGATHHLTNNTANMQVREEFNGSDQLIIGNGQGLPITHVGDANFVFKTSTAQHKHPHIALKDILFVPLITKNLLSISKLTSNNHLSVEFLGNICYVKDALKGEVLLQGIAEKRLYRLLFKPYSSSKSSSSSFLSQISSNKPVSMLSCFHFNSVTYVNNAGRSHSKSCYSSTALLCKTSVNKVALFYNRFGHPNQYILKHVLKNIKSANFSDNQITQALQYICEACQMGKGHKLYFPSSTTKTTKLLEPIHTDL